MMDRKTIDKLEGILSDLTVLEGMLRTVQTAIYSPEYAVNVPLAHAGNSVEVSIEYLSSRVDQLDNLLSCAKGEAENVGNGRT